jgi:hypothetical protein
VQVPAEPQSDAGRELLEAARGFYSRWREFRVRGAGLPLPVREFCSREGLEECLWQAVEMAGEFFPTARVDRFQVMRDPEGDGEWLAVRFAVEGDLGIADIVDRYDAFTDAWLDVAPEWGEEKIRVSFNKA